MLSSAFSLGWGVPAVAYSQEKTDNLAAVGLSAARGACLYPSRNPHKLTADC